MKLAAVLINPDELLINFNQMFVNVEKFQQNFVEIQHRSPSPLLPEFDEIIAGIRRVLPASDESEHSREVTGDKLQPKLNYCRQETADTGPHARC